MYEIETKNGLPIEAISAGCTFGNVVIADYFDIESVIDWSKIVRQ